MAHSANIRKPCLIIPLTESLITGRVADSPGAHGDDSGHTARTTISGAASPDSQSGSCAGSVEELFGTPRHYRKRAREDDSHSMHSSSPRWEPGQSPPLEDTGDTDTEEIEEDDTADDPEYADCPYYTTTEDAANMPRVRPEVHRAIPGTRGRPLPKHQFAASRMMVIVDVSGVHELPVVFCSCPGAETHDVQLLEMGFYPATAKRPKTAFTFRVLDDFLLTNKECKTAAMNYYNKLRRVTNDLFPHTVPVSLAWGT